VSWESKANETLYLSENFAFGTIYDNGEAYFDYLLGNKIEIPTIFSISYPGLGLPYKMYLDYGQLLYKLNPAFVCNSTHGDCYIPNYDCSMLD